MMQLNKIESVLKKHVYTFIGLGILAGTAGAYVGWYLIIVMLGGL